ncbi:purine-nucleoside phosphorylase [Terriglobus aquaticus]|uniref:Purine nucleoside phosphorylase n=1 Tax=Terriglobus aquaticus TaxID=940139 RepID=A0ABW9KMK6_9BACT|nr:purine-nucleoside phosphorylase [Terriglobus aquaticus]
MTDLYQQASEAAAFLSEKTALKPRLGIILGSGLGEFADSVEDAVAVPYADIPHFPQSTVEGHQGRMVLGTVGGVPVAVMQGRVHAYEGYRMDEVTFPVRVLALLGVRQLVVTNAAGGIDTSYSPGAIVAIRDHINLTGTNAALGRNDSRFGVVPGTGLRFFDMTTAYDAGLRELAVNTAAEQGWTMQSGVYLAVLGPSYETPAEIRAFRVLGADLVGMSTVHEVIVARHMGLQVLGLSLVTNPAAGVIDAPLNHLEVMEVGVQAAKRFGALLTALVPQIAATSDAAATAKEHAA